MGTGRGSLKRTIICVTGLSAASVTAAFFIQSRANRVVSSCSYLDPLAVDVAALAMGVFLIVDGLFGIFAHSRCGLPRQLGRCIRVALGCSVLTIHIMQFIHK